MPAGTFQSRTVPSSACEASSVPSGENATLWTRPVCPINVSLGGLSSISWPYYIPKRSPWGSAL